LPATRLFDHRSYYGTERKNASNVGVIDALRSAETLFRTVDSGVSIERWRFWRESTGRVAAGQEAELVTTWIDSISEFLSGGKFSGRGIVNVNEIAITVSVIFDVSPTGDIHLEYLSWGKSDMPSGDGPISSSGGAAESARKAVGTIVTMLSAYLKQLVPASGHSIMELKGLGKEIGQDMDAQEYVRSERSSWTG
jgi:hypothetical protein